MPRRSPHPLYNAVSRGKPGLPDSVYAGVESVTKPYKCPCCGYKTLEIPSAMGLCPVCWWEDDGQEDGDASDVRLTVNGQLSLHQARVHFAQIGASHPRYLPYVRKPLDSER